VTGVVEQPESLGHAGGTKDPPDVGRTRNETHLDVAHAGLALCEDQGPHAARVERVRLAEIDDHPRGTSCDRLSDALIESIGRLDVQVTDDLNRHDAGVGAVDVHGKTFRSISL
jgi:hypothetical protein